MTDKREVTVDDRVPATARVSVKDVHRYLRRSGWLPYDHRSYAWYRQDGADLPLCVNTPLERVVLRLADFERRQPGEVLADIATEPV